MNRREESWAELRTTTMIIYALYAAAPLLFGVPLLVGGVLAFVKREEMSGSPYFDHLEYLFRTLIGTLIGAVVIFVFARILSSFVSLLMYVAWDVMLLVALWYVYRVAMGFYRLWTDRPVSPSSWL